MNIDKLWSEYRDKIIAEETRIKILTDQIRAIRKIRGFNTDDYMKATEDYAQERSIANARKQCYVQFLADLESLKNDDL